MFGRVRAFSIPVVTPRQGKYTLDNSDLRDESITANIKNYAEIRSINDAARCRNEIYLTLTTTHEITNFIKCCAFIVGALGYGTNVTEQNVGNLLTNTIKKQFTNEQVRVILSMCCMSNRKKGAPIYIPNQLEGFFKHITKDTPLEDAYNQIVNDSLCLAESFNLKNLTEYLPGSDILHEMDNPSTQQPITTRTKSATEGAIQHMPYQTVVDLTAGNPKEANPQVDSDQFIPYEELPCLDLSHELNGKNLSGRNLSGRNLSGRDLSNCNLQNADLSGCNLSGCNLTNANLRNAKMLGTKLDNAILERTNMTGATFDQESSLESVLIKYAKFEESNIADVGKSNFVIDYGDFSVGTLAAIETIPDLDTRIRLIAKLQLDISFVEITNNNKARLEQLMEAIKENPTLSLDEYALVKDSLRYAVEMALEGKDKELPVPELTKTSSLVSVDLN